jgi:hypothetical protein
MLGTLAIWLRILGYDAAYARDVDDEALLQQASSEQRRLLTRDKELASRNDDAILIESTDLEEQLRRVIRATDMALSPDAMLSRCTVCNTPVLKVEKAAVADKVPVYAYERHEEFWRCPSCGRVYWKGTHWDNMQDFIQRLR